LISELEKDGCDTSGIKEPLPKSNNFDAKIENNVTTQVPE